MYAIGVLLWTQKVFHQNYTFIILCSTFFLEFSTQLCYKMIGSTTTYVTSDLNSINSLHMPT